MAMNPISDRTVLLDALHCCTTTNCSLCPVQSGRRDDTCIKRVLAGAEDTIRQLEATAAHYEQSAKDWYQIACQKQAETAKKPNQKKIKYKLFIRYALSGVRTEEIECTTKDDLYCYIGKLYSRTLEKIERVDWKEVKQ